VSRGWLKFDKKMNNTRPPGTVSAWFIYEYGLRKDDWMMSSLIAALSKRFPEIRPAYIHGLFDEYKAGGLRPSRVINLIWVYMAVVFRLFCGKPRFIMVRTTPPCVQLWVVFWAKLFGVPVICWLMDYHPEIEARAFEKRGLKGLAALLRAIDLRLMRHFMVVVTLDEAMAGLAQKNCGSTPVIVHPTWTISGAGSFSEPNYKVGGNDESLTLAYSGNLGAAHKIFTFRKLLRELSKRKKVTLHTIGTGAKGELLFRSVGSECGVSVHHHPRVKFEALGVLYEQLHVDIGVVILSDQYSGLVSPSKFVGYIAFGVPILYFGPKKTNTAEICSRFSAGFELSENASEDELVAIVDQICDREMLNGVICNVRKASEYYADFGAETLAASLDPFLRPLVA
jgi:hypothetical protein